MRIYIGKAICNSCSRTEADMIEVHYASGNAHFCQRGWLRRPDYYEG